MNKGSAPDSLGMCCAAVAAGLLLWSVIGRPGVGYGVALLLIASFGFIVSASIYSFTARLGAQLSIPPTATYLMAVIAAIAGVVGLALVVDSPAGYLLVGGSAVAGRWGRPPGRRRWRDLTVAFVGGVLLWATVGL